MTRAVEDFTDEEVQGIRDAAAARLRDHAPHTLGFDPGCGQCLYCHTCQERVCSLELFIDLVDRNVVRHRRFGNHLGLVPTR